jgi:hypothetical protein
MAPQFVNSDESKSSRPEARANAKESSNMHNLRAQVTTGASLTNS